MFFGLGFTNNLKQKPFNLAHSDGRGQGEGSGDRRPPLQNGVA